MPFNILIWSVLCKISGQTVVEYPDKLFTSDSKMCITGRIYNMQSWTVFNGSGGTKELLVILADKVTNGGVAPMIVLLDISSESPCVVMSEPMENFCNRYVKTLRLKVNSEGVFVIEIQK